MDDLKRVHNHCNGYDGYFQGVLKAQLCCLRHTLGLPLATGSPPIVFCQHRLLVGGWVIPHYGIFCQPTFFLTCMATVCKATVITRSRVATRNWWPQQPRQTWLPAVMAQLAAGNLWGGVRSGCFHRWWAVLSTPDELRRP